ncbi:MAG: hypothetical protein SCM96_14025 [Acidobacteriota bacterium]|nr:hypothetical protein [Acidobacteriota bacterium]
MSPLFLIISSSSLVFFEGKTANADPQKKHPVIMNPKNPILLPDVKQNASIKEVFSIEMSFSEPKEFDTTKRLVSLNVTDVFKKPELLYFGKFVDWGVMSDDKIVVGMSDKYVFHIYEPDGDLIKEFGKEYEPERISPEERNKEMNRAHPSAKDRIKEMVYHKPFHSFTIDNENRIIVRTWEKTEDGKNYFYDVFDPEGVYISRFPGNFSIKQWIHDQFLAVEDIPGGKSAVKIYRVIWK